MPTTGWPSASGTRHGQHLKTKRSSACGGSEEDMRASQFAKLTAFVAVAEHTSFTRAATQLGISNPSLSHGIRSLEDQLGVRLLNRTTRNVALTEAGAELLAHLNPALERFEKALDVVNAFRAKLGGTLRVAVHPVAAGTIVPSLIARFSAQNPDIRLEIYVDRERGDIVATASTLVFRSMAVSPRI